ncbi:hypothetical protein [Flavipsychrobacter stenotrophus]|nr:hypothetical protein [Flavipsychrobacter stenotrophus]
MGLDMRPMGKPKPGCEQQFNELFKRLSNTKTTELSWLDKLRGKKVPPHESKEKLQEEWLAMQIPAYETIKAPRVGRDSEANDWIVEKYKESNTELSEADFIREYDGYYVIELAKELDGVPMYIAMGQDENVFRG